MTNKEIESMLIIMAESMAKETIKTLEKSLSLYCHDDKVVKQAVLLVVIKMKESCEKQ